MRILSTRTFRVEAAVIVITCVAIAALALLLVRDAASHTESTLRAAAEEELTRALNELVQQYEERSTFSERPLNALPLHAQDLSLRGLAQAVLRSYPDMQGGFYHSETGTVVGAAGPASSLREDVVAAIRSAVARTSPLATESGGDLLVSGASPLSDGNHAWAVRRLSGVRVPGLNRRRGLLAAMVLAALVGVAGIISISVRLRRGVDGIKQILQRLESDFSYRPAPASDDFGEIHAAIAKMADHRTELEGILRRQDRLAALGKVVAGVAHEVRNPLNSMRLQLELLKRRTQKGIASTVEVEAAMEQVDRLESIVGKLLAFGNPRTAGRTMQDVVPLAKHSLEMVQDRASSKGVDLVLSAEGSAVAHVDGVQIEQVLTNLLLNAVEASPEATPVEMRVAAAANEGVEIQVTDRGPGIPDGVRDHVFDAFFTTRSDGAGLGLSVSREIVAAHGGSLDFSSGSGSTTFVLRLPGRNNE